MTPVVYSANGRVNHAEGAAGRFRGRDFPADDVRRPAQRQAILVQRIRA